MSPQQPRSKGWPGEDRANLSVKWHTARSTGHKNPGNVWSSCPHPSAPLTTPISLQISAPLQSQSVQFLVSLDSFSMKTWVKVYDRCQMRTSFSAGSSARTPDSLYLGLYHREIKKLNKLQKQSMFWWICFDWYVHNSKLFVITNFWNY